MLHHEALRQLTHDRQHERRREAEAHQRESAVLQEDASSHHDCLLSLELGRAEDEGGELLHVGVLRAAVVGGGAGVVAGGAAGTVIDPPERVRTYVSTNEIEPVYLDGEVVVGAGLPETVELREIPDYEYRYVYVNSQPVLVEPTSRRIVYVY